MDLSKAEMNAIRRGRIRPIDMKTLFKHKLNENNELIYKVRIVIRGFRQRPNIDYDETYAATLNKIIGKMMLHICKIMKWHLSLHDIGGAFAEANIDKVLYGVLPAAAQTDNQSMSDSTSLYTV